MADSNTATQLTYDLVPSPQLQAKLQRQMADLERNLKFKAPFGQATREVRDFGSELDRANQRVITLGASFTVLATSLRVMKDIVRSTVEVEKAFTEINAVFQLGAKGLDQFSKQLFDAARNTGSSFEKAADAAKEFSRQGLTAQETIKRTTDALILSRLANLDVAKSVDTLTASINGFQKSALSSSEIVNKLATVDAKFAVSSADLAEALSRSGAAASDAGVSFDQLIGLVTAAQQTTARGGTVIGNALKTIFTRVERRDTIDAFESLGVAVKDAQGNMLGALPLLQNFAATYDKLGGSLRKQAADMVGGVYQINILKAVLGDLAKANGIAAQATDVSRNATNEAIKRNEALNQSLDAMLTKLGVAGKQIGANIGSQSFSGPLKSLIGAALNNPITAALEDASGKAETAGGKFAEFFLKGLGGSLVYGLGPLIVKALGTVAIRTGSNILKDFSLLTNISTQAQQEAAIQKEVVNLYRQGGVALQQQLATITSVTEQAALLQRLLTGSGNNNAAQMAQAMMGAGYRGRGRTPGAAGGYIPMGEESAAIAAGVGGAPAGSRPVYLPSFNRGGGQRGIVANTSEWMVPGAAGGAIYNVDMIRKGGLPPGATPVAAGGYIPHAAGGTPDYSDPSYYKWRPLPLAGAFGVGPDDPRLRVTSSGGSFGGGASGQGFGQYAQAVQANTAALIQLTATEKIKIVTGDGPLSPLNTAVHQQNPGYGRDYDSYMSRVDAASRVRQFANRRNAPSMEQIESVLNANEAIEPFGKLPPNMVANLRTGPRLQSWSQRNMPTLGRFMPRGGALGFGAMLAPAFLAAQIDEGAGGTGDGMWRGAVRSGGSAATAGASLGSIFGPMGTAIGGVGGGVLGGAYGALKKMSQSFEELAKEINEANAKIQRQVEFVQSAFHLQGDVVNAIQNGASANKVDDLRRQRTQSIMAIQDPAIRAQVMAKINSPNGISEITDLLTADQRKNQTATDLRGATRRALDSGGITGGRLGFGQNASSEIAQALLPMLSQMTRQQQISVGNANRTTPIGAFESIGRAAGMDEGQLRQLTAGANADTIELFQSAITEALHKLTNSGILKLAEAMGKADEKTVVFQKSLHQLSAEYQMQSKFIQIQAAATAQINRAQQQSLLARGDLNEGQQVALSGLFSRGDIARDYQSQSRSTTIGGRAALIRAMGKDATGKDSEALRDRLSGLSGLGDFEGLRNDLSSQKGMAGLPGVATQDFKNALEELIATLKELDMTVDEQLKANEAETKSRIDTYRLLGTREGAMGQDDGAVSRAEEAYNRARSRNDSASTIEETFNALQSAMRSSALRRGQGSQLGVDTANLGDRLRASRNVDQGQRDAMLELAARGSPLVSGGDIGGAMFGNARRAGQEGDSKGSFLGGFRSSMDGTKRDLLDFADTGRAVADSLQSNLTNAWTDFVTGAKKGKDAFRDFAVSILGEMSRMAAAKAATAFLSFIPGFGATPAGATGGRFTGSGFMGFAAGGTVPAMLTGGEYYVSPRAAKRIGYDTLKRLNGAQGLAEGGVVKGGSGVRDDVPARLAPGSFIIKKSATQKLGPDYLNALVGGRVQHRGIGGILLGALLGGGVGYAVGGKRGAVGGALLGGIGGYALGSHGSAGQTITSPGGNVTTIAGAGAAPMGMGTRLALGMGLSAGLGLLSGGIHDKGQPSETGSWGLSDVPRMRAQMEADQNAMLGGRGSQHAALQLNPQGGYSIAGLTDQVATRRWASGGGVDVPLTPVSSGPMPRDPVSGGGPCVSIKIDINNNGGTSGSSGSSGGDGPFGTDFASKLEKQVRATVQDELVKQSRNDGFLAQKRRFV